MKTNLNLTTILLVLTLTSCASSPTNIEQVHLDEAFILHSSPNFKGYFYQKSDSSYHYFVSKWQFSKDKYFKLLKSEVRIEIPFEFESKEHLVDLLKTQSALQNKTNVKPNIILE